MKKTHKNVNTSVCLYIYLQQNTETSNILTIENLLSAINLSSYFNINIARLTEKEYKKQTQYIQILTMTEKCVCTLCPNFLWKDSLFPKQTTSS